MMDPCRLAFKAFAAITLTAALVSARAVNISNTWMLPEEGFPVFYRYFRDRISWYEADAVCQFHHANLVTADTTSQYDAIRAYLKELDITENVWIGLSKTSEKPNFSWTDFQPLGGEGHWQEAIPVVNDPLCVAMDPSADFLWKALSCGGPDVASFICELPVPSWALGPRGCLLTELPSLTVLYIPEQLALELTSDCGLDGTKRIACKGDADREAILTQLTCAISNDDFDEKSNSIKPSSPSSSLTTTNTLSTSINDETTTSSSSSSQNAKTTKSAIWTSNTIESDYGMPTRHRRETEDTLSPLSTKSTSTTTDLATKRSRASALGEVDLLSTMSVVVEDFTLSSLSITKRTDRGMVSETDDDGGLGTTEIIDDNTTPIITSDTQQSDNLPEVMSTAIIDVSSPKAASTGYTGEDTGEYPSAINQGQLFSIIENGTMFDIIELNETGADDRKSIKEPSVVTSMPPSSLTTDNQQASIYTTIVHQPHEQLTMINIKKVQTKKGSIKKDLNKKMSITDKTLRINPDSRSRDINDFEATRQQEEEDMRALSKEVELYPIISNSLVKLNRTNRKELPSNNDDDVRTSETIDRIDNNDNLDKEGNFGVPKLLNFSISNHLLSDTEQQLHQHVEIQLHEPENRTIFITTKRTTNASKSDKITNSNNEGNAEKEVTAINNETTVDDLKVINDEHQELSKSLLLGETDHVDLVSSGDDDPLVLGVSSDDPLQPEQQNQKRPNRKRQLTKPQRRSSFYPYFFSRVLG